MRHLVCECTHRHIREKKIKKEQEKKDVIEKKTFNPWLKRLKRVSDM